MKVKMYFTKEGVVNGEVVFPVGMNEVDQGSVFRWEKRGAMRADDPRVEREIRRRKTIEAISEVLEETGKEGIEDLDGKDLEELEKDLLDNLTTDESEEEEVEEEVEEVLETPKKKSGRR